MILPMIQATNTSRTRMMKVKVRPCRSPKTGLLPPFALGKNPLHRDSRQRQINFLISCLHSGTPSHARCLVVWLGQQPSWAVAWPSPYERDV